MDEEFDKVSLSELQLAIMRVLWQHPDSTIAQVVQHLQPDRELAHTTVATLLSRLEKRELIHATKEGRQLMYRALISESHIQRSMVADLLSNLFMGKTSALLSHLVNESTMDENELEQIRLLLAQKGKQK